MTESEKPTPEPFKPPCRMVGQDGNVFAIIARVRKALRDAGLHERAEEFVQRATSSESYDAVLALVWEYVDVE